MPATFKKVIWGLAILMCCKSSYAELNAELKQNVGQSCQGKSELAAQIMSEHQNGKLFVDMVQTAANMQKNATTDDQHALAQFYAAIALKVSRLPVESSNSAKKVKIEELRQMVLTSCQQNQI
ncbi:hypothetical protein [Acinetobacter sp. MB5]|uniref:hypothetical protein n=1 Tax=Acinetobacter sp. MB5 TaxID=2069438 RepID=UPI000DCF8FCD|nr:hypothetical protein [Acinetobacter sp. MB5]